MWEDNWRSYTVAHCVEPNVKSSSFYLFKLMFSTLWFFTPLLNSTAFLDAHSVRFQNRTADDRPGWICTRFLTGMKQQRISSAMWWDAHPLDVANHWSVISIRNNYFKLISLLLSVLWMTPDVLSWLGPYEVVGYEASKPNWTLRNHGSSDRTSISSLSNS